MYVYAVSRKPRPDSVTPFTGDAWVPLMLNNTFAFVTTYCVSAGGAPVPLYHKYSRPFVSSKNHCTAHRHAQITVWPRVTGRESRLTQVDSPRFRCPTLRTHSRRRTLGRHPRHGHPGSHPCPTRSQRLCRSVEPLPETYGGNTRTFETHTATQKVRQEDRQTVR